jgi:hypothetical protein
MASRRELTAALQRQRRFLVLMSLAVTAYYVLRVHVKGEAQYGGVAVTVGNPGRLQYCLWVVFAWALLRYVQRLNELWTRVRSEVMRNVEAEDQQLALKAATRSARRQVKRGELATRFDRPQVRGKAWLNPSMKQAMREVRKDEFEPRKIKDPDYELTQSGGRKYRSFAIVIAYTDKAGNFNQRGQDFNMPEWNRARTVLHRIHAWVRAAARLPAIFEHWAPLVIAGMAICVAIAMTWIDRPRWI